jgi:phosphatidylinositol glycan class O
MENPPDLRDPSEQNRQLITKYQLSNMVILGWFGALYYLGAHLFHHGFLLTRNELTAVSTVVPKWEYTQPKYDQVVLLVVDALRYDFIKEQPGSKTHYHNHLPFVKETIEKHPNSSYISKFIADAPTTTLQRLKALTTGVLPTFMDMSSNFHGSELMEDNWISQLTNRGDKVGFVGDDTWTTLFNEASFVESHPFPSFDVWDLDTVDNGVKDKLIPMIESKKFKVTIGHMLGVDHCGHRYGPDHSKMEEKLIELDQFLRQIYGAIDENTLVMVFGDHGMTPTGDHGGETSWETTAGFFTFSKSALPNPSARQDEEVQQIDIVPTLSYLLELPIPFNSLGSLIPSLVAQSSKNYANVNTQIYQYLKEYASIYHDSDLANKILPKLEPEYESLKSIKSSKPVVEKISAQVEFNRLALEEIRSVWTQFDLTKMYLGIAIIAITIVLNIFQAYYRTDPIKDPEPATGILTNPYSAKLGYQIGVLFLTGIIFALLTGFVAFKYFGVALLDIGQVMAVGGAAGSLVGYVLQYVYKDEDETIKHTSSLKTIWIPLFATALFIYFLVFPASNSFVIMEDSNLLGILQTFAVFAIGHGFWYHSSSSQPDKNIKKQLLYFGLAFLVINRLLGYSTVCREEQLPKCVPTFYHTGLSAHKLVLVLQFVLSLAIPQALKYFLKRTQNYHGAIILWTQILMPSILLLTTVYQYLENYSSELTEVPYIEFIKVWSIRCAGIISVVGLGSWFYCPTLLDAQMIETGTGSFEDPKLRSMILFGFGNAYGAPILHFMTIVFTILNMFQKPMGSLALAGMLAQFAILAEVFDALKDSVVLLQAEEVNKQRPGGLPSRSLDLLHLILQIIICYLGYFATGHQMTPSSIQWNVGTVGLFEFSEIFSPIFIILNTLGPFFFAGLAIFLIPLWKAPMLRSRLYFTLPSHLSRTMLNLSFIIGLQLLGSAVWSMHHRRHLMLWKIFAPRFLGAELSSVAIWISLMGMGHFVIAPRIITDIAEILLHVKEANPLPYYFY